MCQTIKKTNLQLHVTGSLRNGGDGRIERSIAYMMDHTNRPLQLSTLAAFVDMSQSRYFELFKHRMGCSPMYYFTRLRMSHARRLLESTSARVKEVAAALGYYDPLYFSKVFKSVHYLPPSRFKSVRDGFAAVTVSRLNTHQVTLINRVKSMSRGTRR
jgi:transcriptional regulator GlxA family with amidase domain